ncbi:MAG: hypothetical protein Q7I99_09220, partial [Acholeplasmataceae bacterium]|nr:hypothetical protein [Acholeplasmataceae bacterium]
SYANWKTINPTIGVIKDFTIPSLFEISYRYDIVANTYQFIDNEGGVYPMVLGSYQFEANLEIIISAYEPEGQ